MKTPRRSGEDENADAAPDTPEQPRRSAISTGLTALAIAAMAALVAGGLYLLFFPADKMEALREQVLRRSADELEAAQPDAGNAPERLRQALVMAVHARGLDCTNAAPPQELADDGYRLVCDEGAYRILAGEDNSLSITPE